jgi:Uma2 family endonuclease
MALQKKKALPTWRDLPVGDGIPMDNANHPIQATLYLGEPLKRLLQSQGRSAFIGTNCFLYYAVGTRPCGPDFMVVNGGKDEGQGSWVVYSEGDLRPTFICEMLSPTSETADRTTKLARYERLEVLDYVLYDTETQRLEVYHYVGGRYVPVLPLPSGRFPLQSLPLQLGIVGKWLRWFTPSGELLLTGTEWAEQEHHDAEQERQTAERERQRAEQERQRADEAEARLRALEARLRDLESPPGHHDS